jgi:hypothetical protein
MAIKVSGITVIDDNRVLIPTAIQLNSTVGTAGSVLISTGSGVDWGTIEGGGSKGFSYFLAATV